MTACPSTYVDFTPVAFMRRPPDHRLVLTVIVASILAADLVQARPLSYELSPEPTPALAASGASSITR